MCTYNRGPLLADAIRSVLAQAGGGPTFELIVLDNNSTDRTREIAEDFAAHDARVRYAFEPRQGLSFARNTAVLHARAALIAFTDDDVRVEPDWVAAVVRSFSEHPEADMVGGRVLPLWPTAPPAWLTRDHWAPLALADHGDRPIAITPDRPICLIGANLALRRSAFDALGGFAGAFQRVKDGIGSLEDHEFLLRLLRSGRTGLYDPRIVVHAEIQPNRLERAYHRRWHQGHGRFHALLRSEQLEHSRRGTLFGVPAHLYRQALGNLLGWMRARLSGAEARAFQHEVRIRFFLGFFQTRRREWAKGGDDSGRGHRLLDRLTGLAVRQPIDSSLGQEPR
jgi:glycosyltransferase involved in cell wall biosynthesis